MTFPSSIKGSILAGAIGDAMGSGHENLVEEVDDLTADPFNFKPQALKAPAWRITDDTQLTLATIEAMTEHSLLDPKHVAGKMLQYYRDKKLSGLGASTLKALRELEFGGHWSQVGRQGEYAAGNGAAMRVAPLAFDVNLKYETIREICQITHRNEEAYVGAKCIVVAIRAALAGKSTGKEDITGLIIDQIPDTRVRDRLVELRSVKNLAEAGELGSSGYVVDSVPLAIYAAGQVNKIGLENMYQELIAIGGDTDTNCSIAGQVAGAFVGIEGIPISLLNKLMGLGEYTWIERTLDKYLSSSKFSNL